MQKYDVSKYIISNLTNDLSLPAKPVVNRILINNIVDGWNNDIYFQPKDNLKINHYFPKNYRLM